jgi:hypothetical protein
MPWATYLSNPPLFHGAVTARFTKLDASGINVTSLPTANSSQARIGPARLLKHQAATHARRHKVYTEL